MCDYKKNQQAAALSAPVEKLSLPDRMDDREAFINGRTPL